jgi:prophage regulatory protein
MFNNAQGGANMVTSILRLPAVKARTGLSRSTIYLRISEGGFPKAISLGGRAVGWVEAEIDDWLNQQIDNSRKATVLEGRQ